MNKLFISIYIDEDLSQRLAIELRRRGYEAESSHEVGMDEEPDEAQLAYAAGKDYAIMTVNARDFARINKEWLTAGATSQWYYHCASSVERPATF